MKKYKKKNGFEKALHRLYKPGDFGDKLAIILPLIIMEATIYQLVIKSAMYRNIWQTINTQRDEEFKEALKKPLALGEILPVKGWMRNEPKPKRFIFDKK